MAEPPPDFTSNEEKLNPWLSIWTRPRMTVATMVRTNPQKHVILLVVLWGITDSLGRGAGSGIGDRANLLVLLGSAIVAGSLGGVIVLYIASWVLRITGVWLGGEASSRAIRTAFAWATLPVVVTLPFWLGMIAWAGKEVFVSEPFNENDLGSLVYIGFLLMNMVAVIWTLFIFTKGISQVQGFSIWRTISNIVVAIIVGMTPFFILIGVAVALTR